MVRELPSAPRTPATRGGPAPTRVVARDGDDAPGGARRTALSMAGFGTNTALMALAALAVIPALVAAAGPHGWAAVAVGQTVGALTATVTAYGWGISGPALVARAAPADRTQHYLDSLATRLVVALALAVPTVGVVLLVAPRYPELATLGAASSAVMGLTASWYFVGLARPGLLLLCETGPKLAGSATGILLMMTGAGPLWGLAAVIGGVLLAVVVSTVAVLGTRDGRRSGTAWPGPRRIGGLLRSQGGGVVSSAAMSAYTAAPLVLVGALAQPGVLVQFAMLDKIQKQFNSGVAPIVQVFQGWVPRGRDAELGRRTRRALGAAAAMAALLVPVVVVGGPWLVHWLGHGDIGSERLAVLLLGGVLAVILVERVLAWAVLPAHGLTASSARARIAGGLTGVALITVLTLLGAGAAGAMAGLLTGFVVTVVLEVVTLVGKGRGARR